MATQHRRTLPTVIRLAELSSRLIGYPQALPCALAIPVHCPGTRLIVHRTHICHLTTVQDTSPNKHVSFSRANGRAISMVPAQWQRLWRRMVKTPNRFRVGVAMQIQCDHTRIAWSNTNDAIGSNRIISWLRARRSADFPPSRRAKAPLRRDGGSPQDG